MNPAEHTFVNTEAECISFCIERNAAAILYTSLDAPASDNPGLCDCRNVECVSINSPEENYAIYDLTGCYGKFIRIQKRMV